MRTTQSTQCKLLDRLSRLPSVIVAFSGGTDSAYLAWAANQALGNKALAVTAVSATLPETETEAIAKFVRNHGLRHEFITTDELSNPLYAANDRNRCYHCKDELFTKLDALARERGIEAVAYGVNLDDQSDFRPGHRAAAEHRVLTPLLDAGMTKAVIRTLSRRAGLETWNKPAAACLASRIEHGTMVTVENLRQVDRGEQALRSLGFRQVRARYHDNGERVRIEIAKEELPRALAPEMTGEIDRAFKKLGFRTVTIDPEGYRQGSMNQSRFDGMMD